MKRRSLIILLCCIVVTARAQQTENRSGTYNSMFRVYEDNDLLDLRGAGRDQGYTNGTRFDWYYIKNKRSRFFIDRLMPKAGDSSMNTFGWGLMQVMFTPSDISKKFPIPMIILTQGVYLSPTRYIAPMPSKNTICKQNGSWA